MIANEAELTLYDFSFGYWKNSEQLKNANIQNKPTTIIELAKQKFGKKGKVAGYYDRT